MKKFTDKEVSGFLDLLLKEAKQKYSNSKLEQVIHYNAKIMVYLESILKQDLGIYDLINYKIKAFNYGLVKGQDLRVVEINHKGNVYNFDVVVEFEKGCPGDHNTPPVPDQYHLISVFSGDQEITEIIDLDMIELIKERINE